ncbi:MAG: helix-turn-helix domain-containing protein [Moorea sp. SIO1G6]|uniref:helix-turn-helix domain-containing protein n=1 Tax=Moorena sp. SIO1G6 TaxID=2607840 RepID=UPI0013BECD12|nr:helix-turn-helix domain-containing protein [Moorena sp. SIO1G6]NET64927.1 helix-turn-helix domain-containing protein [Moorena sp. SIO1G6]
MSKQRKPRGVTASPEVIMRLEQARVSERDDEGKSLSYEGLAQKAQISKKTVERFFKQKRVDWHSASAIIQALGLKPEDVLFSEESLLLESIEQIQAKDTGDSERAGELIKGLETALSELKKSEEASLEAMEWLKANRKALSQEAAEAALRKHYDQNPNNVDTDYSGDIEVFSQEIREYLKLIYYCLDVGDWELMDRAIKESKIPVNRDLQLYVDALDFIKTQKVSLSFAPEEAKELTLCLDYLIQIIPIKLEA